MNITETVKVWIKLFLRIISFCEIFKFYNMHCSYDLIFFIRQDHKSGLRIARPVMRISNNKRYREDNQIWILRGLQLIMTPNNRARYRLVRGNVISTILFKATTIGRYGRSERSGREEEPGFAFPRVGTPEYRSRFTAQTESNCDPHCCTFDCYRRPAFSCTIIWILRWARLEHRGFPLMIKRLCVTTAPARAIGSTREHCVHNVETGNW